eukprot:6197520-Pleurochrysis_carterae.AAC.4
MAARRWDARSNIVKLIDDANKSDELRRPRCLIHGACLVQRTRVITPQDNATSGGAHALVRRFCVACHECRRNEVCARTR